MMDFTKGGREEGYESVRAACDWAMFVMCVCVCACVRVCMRACLCAYMLSCGACVPYIYRRP